MRVCSQELTENLKGHTGKLQAGLARVLEAVSEKEDPEARPSDGQLTAVGCRVAVCWWKLGAAHEYRLGAIQREGREETSK